jgi:hypothetical protein
MPKDNPRAYKAPKRPSPTQGLKKVSRPEKRGVKKILRKTKKAQKPRRILRDVLGPKRQRK